MKKVYAFSVGRTVRVVAPPRHFQFAASSQMYLDIVGARGCGKIVRRTLERFRGKTVPAYWVRFPQGQDMFLKDFPYRKARLGTGHQWMFAEHELTGRRT